MITTSAERAESVHAADLDGDGDFDVLSASRNDDKIAWYENISNVALTPPITVTKPNGGDTLYADSAALITWESHTVEFVDLAYSIDEGSTWTTIASDVSAAWGSYPWTVGRVNTASALVRVSDAADGTVVDESDAGFTIIGPEIVLQSPNGGEIWEVGSEQTIRWTSVNIDSVAIDFSYDGGASWNEYVVVSGSDTSYSETVGAVTTLSAKIRVRDNADETISDVSDSTFTIQDPTGLTALGIPDEFGLSQNYPNPFNPATTIRYALPEAATVRLTIFNALGQVVRELESSAKQPGYHETSFNASELGSGVYFYRIDAVGSSGERFQETRKMLLVK